MNNATGYEFTETLLSMQSLASDVQRWVVQMALAGRASRDRQSDIRASAERLAQLAQSLWPTPTEERTI